MNKELTKEQIERLAKYEEYFGCAVRSGYCSHPGEHAMEEMRAVWAELTGKTYPYNASCSTCMFNVVKDMGLLYFAAIGRSAWDKCNSKTYVLNKPAEPAQPKGFFSKFTNKKSGKKK